MAGQQPPPATGRFYNNQNGNRPATGRFDNDKGWLNLKGNGRHPLTSVSVTREGKIAVRARPMRNVARAVFRAQTTVG